MKPDAKLIKISNNEAQIKTLIEELVLAPRLKAMKWSDITKQTPNIKIGYPGQHLASLITGMFGERSGARGNDIADGSEVKSCSRIDQLDVCGDCKSPVARSENACSGCGSEKISRKDDSKWLFTVRNENDLNVLTNEVKRVFLIIGDYPNFESGDFSTLRFQSYEIWTNSSRCSRFKEIMTNYYQKIYLTHKGNTPDKTPAPKNFWPYSYQFYICNPILTFSCIVKNSNTRPILNIEHYIKPNEDRTNIPSIIMPTDVLTEIELDLIISSAPREALLKMMSSKTFPKMEGLNFSQKKDLFKGINEELRSYLPLRDTDKISISKNIYQRRKVI